MAWDVTDGITCVIYWYVQSNQGAKRLPNRLGLGCQSTRNDAKSTISKIVESSTSTKGLLTTRFFRESPYTMQHCDINFCLSGTMGTGIRVIAAIDLFPKALNDWNSNTRANTDQAEIDSLLPSSKESERNDDSAPMWNAGNIVQFVPCGTVDYWIGSSDRWDFVFDMHSYAVKTSRRGLNIFCSSTAWE